MKKKHSLTLSKEFLDFCELNQIDKIDDLARDTFERGFTIVKFGETPAIVKGKETIKGGRRFRIRIEKRILVVQWWTPRNSWIDKSPSLPARKVSQRSHLGWSTSLLQQWPKVVE